MTGRRQEAKLPRVAATPFPRSPHKGALHCFCCAVFQCVASMRLETQASAFRGPDSPMRRNGAVIRFGLRGAWFSMFLLMQISPLLHVRVVWDRLGGL